MEEFYSKKKSSYLLAFYLLFFFGAYFVFGDVCYADDFWETHNLENWLLAWVISWAVAHSSVL